MSQKDNETKCKIVRIALDLIKKNGFDNVTLNDICSAAEISKHTFYYYFSSKEDILLRFYELPNDLTSSRLTSILSAENNFEQLWQLIEPMVDFFVETGPEIMRRVMIANIMRDKGTFNTSKGKSDMAKAQIVIIKKAQESGEILNSSEPIALLHSCIIQAMGSTVQWCIAGGAFDLKNAIRGAVEVCLDVERGLRKSEPFFKNHPHNFKEE